MFISGKSLKPPWWRGTDDDFIKHLSSIDLRHVEGIELLEGKNSYPNKVKYYIVNCKMITSLTHSNFTKPLHYSTNKLGYYTLEVEFDRELEPEEEVEISFKFAEIPEFGLRIVRNYPDEILEEIANNLLELHPRYKDSQVFKNKNKNKK